VWVALQKLPPGSVELIEEDHLVVGKVMQTVPIVNDHLQKTWQLVANREKFVQLFVIFDEKKATIGVVDEVFELRGRVGGVDTGGNATDALDAEIGVDPFLVVF